MGHAQLTVELLRGRMKHVPPKSHIIFQTTIAPARIRSAACSRKRGELIERHDFAGRCARSCWSEDWHPGDRHCASRIVDRYHRPTVMIACRMRRPGIARSVRHFDLAAALTSCGHHLSLTADMRWRRDCASKRAGAAVFGSVRRTCQPISDGDDLVPSFGWTGGGARLFRSSHTEAISGLTFR